MNLNPYISGALTASILLITNRLLPKKITGWKRILILIAVPTIISCIIQFIIDYIYLYWKGC